MKDKSSIAADKKDDAMKQSAKSVSQSHAERDQDSPLVKLKSANEDSPVKIQDTADQDDTDSPTKGLNDVKSVTIVDTKNEVASN